MDFGSYDFRKIEVWVDNVVGLSNRGFTNGQDFKRLLFRNINHQVKEVYIINLMTIIGFVILQIVMLLLMKI